MNDHGYFMSREFVDEVKRALSDSTFLCMLDFSLFFHGPTPECVSCLLLFYCLVTFQLDCKKPFHVLGRHAAVLKMRVSSFE